MSNKTPVVETLKVQQDNYLELFLSVLVDYLSKLDDGSRFVNEEPNYKKACKYALSYLKTTNQYRRQFELCLKMFDGKDSTDFKDSFKDAIRKIFDDYQKELVQDLIQFCKDNINTKKQVDLNFKRVDVQNVEFSNILHWKFKRYGANILNNHRQPHRCRIARINFSSTTTQNKVEGKLRKLGKYASIEEAIEFIEIRIGLFDKYKYKKLVDSLDELAEDMFINSSNNELKESKMQKETKELVKEAHREYEVLNNPKYLIDRNAYTQALRNKIKSFKKEG